MRFNLSDSATGMFDHHPLWGELECIDERLVELSEQFDPAYAGLPGLASEFLRRIEVVVRLARLYLGAAPKEAVGSPLLDELRTSAVQILTAIRSITWDDDTDYDLVLSEANAAANALLNSLYMLRDFPIDMSDATRAADESERERITSFLENAQRTVNRLENDGQGLRELLAANKTASKEELAELRQKIEEVATSFEDQIDEGVAEGKKRIDDQIDNLRANYNSEIEKQKSRADEDLQEILDDVQRQKHELDAMVENTKTVSGYVAETAMSRMFKDQAKESKRLWIGFTLAAVAVALVSAGFLYSAGETALEASATSADIIRGLVRVIGSLGSGAVAAYLFGQASAQRRNFQDSRSAQVRLGSLDAFLARFDDDEAQEIRRGVGKRVYVDGELGEIARRDLGTGSHHSKQESREGVASKETETSSGED